MTVITISRQMGSGGEEIADRLCELLGYQQFDKRLLANAAAQVGLSSQEVLDYSEENHKVRGFLDRVFGIGPTIPPARAWIEDPTGALIPESIILSEEVLMDLVQKAIFSAQRAGNMVILGRGGQVVLRDVPNVLHIRTEAPLEQRIQRVKAELRETQPFSGADIELRRAAQDLINERDLASADYLKRFYRVDWEDPMLYHLIINTGRVSIEQAVGLVVKLVQESAAVREPAAGEPAATREPAAA